MGEPALDRTINPDPPGAVLWIAGRLEGAGYETWAVGGAVRDTLLGRPSGDWDLATRATPTQVQGLFRRTVPIGVEHGTVGVLSGDGVLYEVTTFRRDVETTGRHAVVEFAETLDEDLARRDFTINAIAWHPLSEAVRDPFDGQSDLKRGLLRTVGSPADRFAEDYLRVLRALRFAGTYRLRIEAATWSALTAAVEHTKELSPERLREELERVLKGTVPPSRALSLYAASGVLSFLFPELDATIGLDRGRNGDWYAHTLRIADVLTSRDTTLRWAALFQGTGEVSESMGAAVEEGDAGQRALLRTAAVMERLRSSNAMVRRVAELAQWIGYPPRSDESDEVLRRWLSASGRHTLISLIRVWIACVRADEAMSAGLPSGAVKGRWDRSELLQLYARLRSLTRSGAPLHVGELSVSGRDLIQMGYAPGPEFGEVLDHLLDFTLEDPRRNVSELLREEADRWMSERGQAR